MTTTRSLAIGVAVALVASTGSRPTGLSAAAAPTVFISEVHPGGSGNGTYGADWFEVTNTGTSALTLTGWKMDDNSNAFGNAVALRGVASIPAGRSAVFLEGTTDGITDATIIANFSTAWFGSATPPTGVLIGAYGGSGVGLSTTADAVNLFDAAGARVAGIGFGASPTGSPARTFDNTARLSSTGLPLPMVSTVSAAGLNGAFAAFNGGEIGSPGNRFNSSPVSTVGGVDLSTYVRVGRFDLPEPKRTSAPPNSVLAQEVSAVTYNWDTDTLFVVGDGGTAVVQVSKTGQLIDSMTLAPGGSPQGTDFYDPEGLTYVGGGNFVMVEERDRQAVLFTYAAGATLTRSGARTVKLGTFSDNMGIEGISYDPLTNGFIAVKEIQDQGLFQTGIDFFAGTATNGSPATANSLDLFPPALAGLADFADVYALSNLSSMSGPEFGNLLVLSQESGRIVNIDRAGVTSSSLTIQSDAGNPLTVPNQQHEGLTMDGDGRLYVVNENGGGDSDHPQLWVYAASSVPNQAPTAIVPSNEVTTIAENTSTTTRIKVADITITDDGVGTNILTVTGPDSGFFEADTTGLYIKAGTILDFETKAAYSVTVAVDDASVGGSPDATAAYGLTLIDVLNENPSPPSLIISEVVPWSSGNAPYEADWFEVTNTGSVDVNIAGWKMDDNSNAFANAVALRGVLSIPAGKSVVFFEGNATGTTDATIVAAFSSAWFGAPTPPTGFLIGAYGGSGVGLSTSGDAVNLFDATGNRITGVSVGASTTGFTFENTTGIGSSTPPPPAISTLSVAGVHGALVASDGAETGSPGTIAASVVISEISPWSSGNTPYAADWFEVTNTGIVPVSVAGWKMDDNSNVFVNAVPLRGVTRIPAGRTAIFLEGEAPGTTDATIIAAFSNAWFGSATPPPGFLIGAYGGSGVGLSTGGDSVNLFDSIGNRLTGIRFGNSTSGFTFDNLAGVGSTTLPLPAVATLSVAGASGAFLAFDGLETGSPGVIPNVTNNAQLTRSGYVRDRRTSTYAQQLTLTNTSGTTLAGPFFVVFDSLSANADLANRTGTTTILPPLGSPYVLVPGAAGGLAPGASLTVTLQFTNSVNAAITYSPRVVNGVAVP